MIIIHTVNFPKTKNYIYIPNKPDNYIGPQRKIKTY